MISGILLLCIIYVFETQTFLEMISKSISLRERVTKLTTMSTNNTRRVTDAEVLEFYNLATSKILTGLEVYINYKHNRNRKCSLQKISSIIAYYKCI